MSGSFRMDDYVDVAQRIHEFYERFPDGSLKTGTHPHVIEIGDKPFIVYHARAYRTPDDPKPTDGWAWEPVPGPTQFTRDSELMNAETAAWGRAIVALGFSTKKIASAQEVRARTDERVPDPNGFAASRADAPLNDHAQVRVHFGSNAGKLVADLEKKSREWYAGDGWATKKAESDRPVTEEDLRLRRAARVLSGMPIEETDGPFISDDSIPF